MPNKNLLEGQLEQETTQYVEQATHFTSTKDSIRAGFEDFIRVNFDETGLLSAGEVASQRQYVNSILNDPNASKDKLQELAGSYLGSFAEQSKEANIRVYFNDAIAPLKQALATGVISSESYREWIDWIRDPSRAAKEKKGSIASTLPAYLEKRYQLARRRTTLIRNPRFTTLEQSTDPKLKALATKISDNTYFLQTLSFSEREQVLTEATAALPVAAEEQAIFHQFITDLDSAVRDELISEQSKQKWIARFKDPSVGSRAKVYFVNSQFPSYVSAWQKVRHERSQLMKDPTVKELTDKDLKSLTSFTNQQTFLGLHYDRKVSLLSEVRAAAKAHQEHKQALHSETKSILETAAAAGYIGPNKVGPWLEHVIDGSRSLPELKTFIKDWAKVRYRFDNIEMTMTEGKVPQGLQRLSVESFLSLNYAQRLSYVNEAERRLKIESDPPENSPLQDAKGKVRHALDLENWEEADYFLAQAWPLAETESDRLELQSMEKYLTAYRETPPVESAPPDKETEVANAYQEIETVLALLPAGLQAVYRKALSKGSACLQCVTTCVYNRTWCEERGFLDGAMEEKLREQSIQETALRTRAGGEGHSDGVENNFVDGYQQPAIRDKGMGPQNLFMSGSGADAFVEKADANKNTFTFWYWTNLIVDGVSSQQNAYASYALNYRIKAAARTLEKHGKRYGSSLPSFSVN